MSSSNILAAALLLLLAGCYRPSVLPQSEGHITAPASQPAAGEAPPPARISNFVPPPAPSVKQPTYSVVVDEVPVKELLFALARDTKQNIDIYPGLQGLVSLNAINETLPAILDRIANQVNLRYRIEGNIIIVTPDTPYTKTYRINYVNVARDTTSTIGVSGQITSSGSGTGSATASAGGSTTNASTTTVTTTSNNDFWKKLEDNIRSLLNSTLQQNLSEEARAQRLALIKQQQEIAAQQMEAASKAGQSAPQLLTSSGSVQQQKSLLPDDVVVNPFAGTVTVNATERQHKLVQEYLDNVTKSVERQVLIEATVVEVTLGDNYQGGIDWSRLAASGGLNITQALLGNLPSNQLNTSVFPGSLTIGYANPTSKFGNISETIKLLNQFGNTRVLSSPKLMALNNQTALLKAVDNLVYFQIESQQGTISSSGTQTPPTFNTTAQTVAVGIVMSVTPQINDNGQITLTVRPSITSQIGTVNDPNPDLCSQAVVASIGQCLTNPVPEIRTREMESVLRLVSGQTAVLGGLMQDTVDYERNAVPGIGNIPVIKELFSSRNDSVKKSELVIFLRPTVITNPSLESDELSFFQHFLPQQREAPTETTPGEIGSKP